MENKKAPIAKDEMNNRDFFYGARILSDEFKSGQKYSEMPKVRVINILDFFGKRR